MTEEMQQKKLELEIEKLRCEIDELKGSYWRRNVKELATVLVLIISVGGNIGQGVTATEKIIGYKNQIAYNKEQEGYQKMIDGDFEGARESFKEAENAVNGYRNAYELVTLLRGIKNEDMKNEDMKNDSNKKRKIIEEVIRQNYANNTQVKALKKLGGIPDDTK